MDPYKQLADALDEDMKSMTPTGRFIGSSSILAAPYTSTLPPEELAAQRIVVTDYATIEKHILAQLATEITLTGEALLGRKDGQLALYADYAKVEPPARDHRPADMKPRRKDPKATAKRRAANRARAQNKGRR